MAKHSHKTEAKILLELLGWTVADVEVQDRYSHRTKDLWNFADLLAVKPGVGTLGLQVTSDSGGNAAKRVGNVFASPQLKACLQTNWIVEVWAIRNKPTKAGSTVQARTIELSKDGGTVIAYEGSKILPWSITHGGDNHAQGTKDAREEGHAQERGGGKKGRGVGTGS